jgi:hypothetical protein
MVEAVMEAVVVAVIATKESRRCQHQRSREDGPPGEKNKFIYYLGMVKIVIILRKSNFSVIFFSE